jgi:dTDP-4-dehydrorhamnose reductase
MRTVITGASGQLGRALAASAPRSAEVISLGRAELDLADPDAIGRVLEAHRPAVILNAAAYTAVDRAESEPELAQAVNGTAPGVLAETAVRLGASLVHVSTDFVFDGAAGVPYPPDAAPGPLGLYGATKLAGEQAVRRALPSALIIRTAWVYGVHGPNFVHTMLRLMRERDEVRVVCDQIGTPTHVPGLAQALWALVAAGAEGTHHWTDAGAASWYDFAVAIQEEALAAGLLARAVPVIPIATSDYPTPARRPPYSVLDKRSSWAILGAPAPHWRTELRTMLAGLKDLANG